ncbi:hypothetical protein NPX13_g5244 [Xylaria arbuscula]|uniref:NACHT domain-containing protein n=1 Tax=Xylaria arbuscula TaxID=114810 RepID=A0A9W8TNB7_9PEZI|nr:hypothetical protein NPX13_g5244 [Xylaria arbuscula]
MDPAGLGVGIIGLIGLFGSCIEMVERWNSYKEFVAESGSLKARLNAERVRLQVWGKKVGIDKDLSKKGCHPALDDPSIRSAIETLLRSINNLDENASRIAPHLEQLSTAPGLPLCENSHSSQPTKLLESSRRMSRIVWALRGKGRATMLVVSFEILVQKLHDLVPIPKAIANFRDGGADAISSSEEKNAPWHVDAQRRLADLEKHIHLEIRKDLMNWIDAQGTEGIYRDRIERRLKNTCDWVLQTTEFRQWHSRENAKILWINGPPGYGKTILAARTVEHLSQDPNINLAYYFSSAETQYRADPLTVIRAWVSQLTMRTQQGYNLAREKWERADERTASLFDIKELFKVMLQNIRCTLVVDGLDECNATNGNQTHGASLSEFLNYLITTTSEPRVKLLIVSRNELTIRDGLFGNGNDMKKHLLELQIRSKDINNDSITFARTIVDRKLSNKPEEQREQLTNQLVDRCDSMFLGIKLLEDDLTGGKNFKQLQRVVDEAPNKLDFIYDRNWEKIQSHEQGRRHRALWILRWAAFARRPLTVLEMTEALLLNGRYDECEELDYEELPDTIDSIYLKTEILDPCVSLVEIQPGSTPNLGDCTIHLTHFSILQYILRHIPIHSAGLIANEQLRSSNDKFQNNLIAETCLRYLNSWQTWKETKLEGRNCAAIQAFRAYATVSWPRHVRLDIDNSRDIIELVKKFFRPENQNWQSWRKVFDVSMNQSSFLKYDGTIDIGNPLFYASVLRLEYIFDYLMDEIGLDVNYVDSSNRTALLALAVGGSVKSVSDLLQKGADTNIASNIGATPLQISSVKGDVEIVRKLLQYGADPMLATKEGYTPLFLASMRGHLQIVEMLIKQGADLLRKTNAGVTALGIASYLGQLEVLKILLDGGADIHVSGMEGFTPLHVASFQGQVQVVKVLLEKGADPQRQNVDGRTALHMASENGHIEIVQLLLDSGALPDLKTDNNWTALHMASKNGCIEIVQLLLDSGARPDLKTDDGWTPLLLALVKDHIHLFELLDDNGATVNSVHPLYGRSALSYAAEEGSINSVKSLLKVGADPNSRDVFDRTPLFYATWRGNVEIFDLLFSMGTVPINFRDYYGSTCLSIAARHGHIDLLTHLLSMAEVDLCTKDDFGRGLLSCSAAPAIRKLLEDEASKRGLFLCTSGGVSHFSSPHKTIQWSCDVWASCLEDSHQLVEKVTQASDSDDHDDR